MVRAGCKNGKGFICEIMLPFDIHIPVAVFISCVIVQIKAVAAQIAHYIQGILCIDDVTEVQVAIIEISPAVTVS